MNYDHQALHDNRLWAVLCLGVVMLALPVIHIVNNMHPSATSSSHMVLRYNGRGLEWTETKGGKVMHADVLRAELTPFFFAPVPVNRADLQLLSTLPGIGPGMAERIIDFRNNHGTINNAQDFLRIPGIGPKRYTTLQQYITFK